MRGQRIGLGDRVATRANDRDLDVANRDTWTVTGLGADGSLQVDGRRGPRLLPASYVRADVELAYASTVYGAQGETVDTAHLLVGEQTGAAAAYVAMTRGRHANTAHLVADSVQDARRQWIEVFARDRADLGPAHAARLAADDIDRYGPSAIMQRAALQAAAHEMRPTRPNRRPTRTPIAAQYPDQASASDRSDSLDVAEAVRGAGTGRISQRSMSDPARRPIVPVRVA